MNFEVLLTDKFDRQKYLEPCVSWGSHMEVLATAIVLRVHLVEVLMGRVPPLEVL